MIIQTGDVIRLGRVCYIVKETSIELGEKALKLVENYAQQKNKLWESLISSTAHTPGGESAVKKAEIQHNADENNERRLSSPQSVDKTNI